MSNIRWELTMKYNPANCSICGKYTRAYSICPRCGIKSASIGGIPYCWDCMGLTQKIYYGTDMPIFNCPSGHVLNAGEVGYLMMASE